MIEIRVVDGRREVVDVQEALAPKRRSELLDIIREADRGIAANQAAKDEATRILAENAALFDDVEADPIPIAPLAPLVEEGR